MTAPKTNRCVHCLEIYPEQQMTEDHVPPSSWYPDTTPGSVQYLKIPSCTKCNGDLGRKEKDFLIRIGLCIDPSSEEASGLAAKALRSLGIDAGALSEGEKKHREMARAKIRSQLLIQTEVAEASIRGLGPRDGGLSEATALPIAYADISHIAEKMARGFEYKRAKRYIEPPYGLRTFIADPSSFLDAPTKLQATISGQMCEYDLGPGFKIKCVFSPERPLHEVGYWFLLWGTFCLSVMIALEDSLRAEESRFHKPKGLTREQLIEKRKFPA